MSSAGLSGYGNDEKEAEASFQTHLLEYLQYSTNKNTLWTDLKKLGWIIRKNVKKPATPPTMSELLEKNEEFSRIFNLYPYKKLMPASHFQLMPDGETKKHLTKNLSLVPSSLRV